MASKINKKMNVSVEGILNLDDGITKLEVQDISDPIILADLIKEFADKTVKITVAYGEEL